MVKKNNPCFPYKKIKRNPYGVKPNSANGFTLPL